MSSKLKSSALNGLIEKIGPELADELAEHYLAKTSEKEYLLVLNIKNVREIIEDFITTDDEITLLKKRFFQQKEEFLKNYSNNIELPIIENEVNEEEKILIKMENEIKRKIGVFLKNNESVFESLRDKYYMFLKQFIEKFSQHIENISLTEEEMKLYNESKNYHYFYCYHLFNYNYPGKFNGSLKESTDVLIWKKEYNCFFKIQKVKKGQYVLKIICFQRAYAEIHYIIGNNLCDLKNQKEISGNVTILDIFRIV